MTAHRMLHRQKDSTSALSMMQGQWCKTFTFAEADLGVLAMCSDG